MRTHFPKDCGLPKSHWAPICDRVPNWADMSNIWANVTCKWCLKHKPGEAEQARLRPETSRRGERVTDK